MKEIVITKKGGPEVLVVKERADPAPGNGEVRIRVKATGVNFADTMARVGMYPDAPPIPCVVGYEVSGIVDAVGTGVDSVEWLDKEVIALTKFGGYADTVIVPLPYCIKKPTKLTHNEAASIPVVYLTAWMLLMHMGSLKGGQTVLVQNAGGGVGLAALDIAKHVGATVIGTASKGKHQLLTERGIDHAIDYRTQNVVEEVNRITNGKGVDLIIDPIGGEDWKKNYSMLRKGGRLGMFGLSSAKTTTTGALISVAGAFLGALIKMPKWSPLELMDQNKAVFGVNLGHMFDEAEIVQDWLKDIMQGVEDGWVRPRVDAVFDFSKAGEAHTHIEGRKNIGKVVLVPSSE